MFTLQYTPIIIIYTRNANHCVPTSRQPAPEPRFYLNTVTENQGEKEDGQTDQ